MRKQSPPGHRLITRKKILYCLGKIWNINTYYQTKDGSISVRLIYVLILLKKKKVKWFNFFLNNTCT